METEFGGSDIGLDVISSGACYWMTVVVTFYAHVGFSGLYASPCSTGL